MINIKEVEKFVKPFYLKKDCMHNWNHIKRIKRNVTLLKKQYKHLDNNLLNFLIYFHGLRKWANKNKKKILELGYPLSFINKINKPSTNEGKIVLDANYLENVGEYGIRKSLMLEKYYGQTREETLKIVKRFISKYKFYTPLGKRRGNLGIEIKRKWLEKELSKHKK